MTEQLKGISSPAEVARLSAIIAELSTKFTNGQIAVISFAPLGEPDIGNDRIPQGYTYYDKDSKKVRTWDGSAWKDHY